MKAGDYVTGTWKSYRFGTIGQNDTKIMEITMDTEDGEQKTTVFMGDKVGKDGKTNTGRLMDRLVELGCEEARLRAAGWRDHITMTMQNRPITAKCEEYSGRLSLRGLYTGGGMKPLELDASPFTDSGGDDMPF